jgi:hypothetical protein
MFKLTDQELEQFVVQGWAGPFSLFEKVEANSLAPALMRCFRQPRGFYYPEHIEPGKSYYSDTPWFQSLHSLSSEIRAVGQCPEIIARVGQILGDNVMQWASICFPQGPGESLHWHTDTEYDYVDAVGIWLAIDNVTPQTALKILPGSHLLPKSP